MPGALIDTPPLPPPLPVDCERYATPAELDTFRQVLADGATVTHTQTVGPWLYVRLDGVRRCHVPALGELGAGAPTALGPEAWCVYLPLRAQ